jgi:hypothetical protein
VQEAQPQEQVEQPLALEPLALEPQLLEPLALEPQLLEQEPLEQEWEPEVPWHLWQEVMRQVKLCDLVKAEDMVLVVHNSLPLNQQPLHMTHNLTTTWLAGLNTHSTTISKILYK